MNDIDGKPQWEIHFDEKGAVAKGQTIDQIIAEVKAKGVTELVIFSHGWNNDETSARNLYDKMFPLIGAEAKAHAPELFAGIGYLGVFWPSIWFPDEAKAQDQKDRAEGGSDTLSSDGQSEPPAGGDDLAELTGAELAAQVKDAFPSGGQAKILEIGQLIDEGIAAAASAQPDAEETERIARISELLHDVTGPWPTSEEEKAKRDDEPTGKEDRGEQAAFVAREGPEAARVYGLLADKFGGVPTGGDAQFSFGDLNPLKVYHGVKGSLRFASFFQMKARAGVVGESGLAQLVAAISSVAPDLHVHLVGHSFGARLVSFSLKGIDDPSKSPVRSLTLIQGAFSHWTFANPQPWNHPGELHNFANRVKGPLVSIFSKNDRALGTWYPLASVINESDAQATVVNNERWGGMGSDGFQSVSAPLTPVGIKESGQAYTLAKNTFYAINGSRVVAKSLSKFSGAHSDIKHPQVAWVVVSAAAVGAVG